MTDEVQIATAQANGNSTAIEISRYGHTAASHLRTLFVTGTFNGATVKYQISNDNVTFYDVADADAITADKVINIEHRARYQRINVAGGGGSESINAFVV
jgi:hypothetical protein